VGDVPTHPCAGATDALRPASLGAEPLPPTSATNLGCERPLCGQALHEANDHWLRCHAIQLWGLSVPAALQPHAAPPLSSLIERKTDVCVQFVVRVRGRESIVYYLYRV